MNLFAKKIWPDSFGMTERILKSFTLLCIFIHGNTFCQDTIMLKEVDVVSKKIELSAIGKKIQVMDSSIKQQFI